MAEGIRPRIRVPATARAGEPFEIKVMVSHPMESGERLDPQGARIPRGIIHRFVARFEGAVVIDVTMEPAISNNPYFAFEAVVPRSGTFAFAWHDDDGDVYRAAAVIEIV